MLQFVKGYFGFFDPGTSDAGSLSLWFRSNVSGTRGLYEGLIVRERMEEANLPDVNTLPDALLPKHRTWSGGMLFTLPEAQSYVFDIAHIYSTNKPPSSAPKPYEYRSGGNGITGFHSSECDTTFQTHQNRLVEVAGPLPLEDDTVKPLYKDAPS
jgi:hypothetical protein